jgi:hypothetical protein
VSRRSVAEALGPSSGTTAVQHRTASGNLLFGGPALFHESLLEAPGHFKIHNDLTV